MHVFRFAACFLVTCALAVPAWAQQPLPAENPGETTVALITPEKEQAATAQQARPGEILPETSIETANVLKLSAGDLKVSGIEGSKDVEARAGDVTIAVGERDLYRHVNASIRIGDLNAEPFNVNKGGFFRSFEWSGKGQYDLRAHLTVGDLKLTR